MNFLEINNTKILGSSSEAQAAQCGKMNMGKKRNAFDLRRLLPIEMTGSNHLPVVVGLPQLDDFKSPQAGIDLLAGPPQNSAVADALDKHQDKSISKSDTVDLVTVEKRIRFGHSLLQMLRPVIRQLPFRPQTDSFDNTVVACHEHKIKSTHRQFFKRARIATSSASPIASASFRFVPSAAAASRRASTACLKAGAAGFHDWITFPSATCTGYSFV